jgi:retinoblastoma-like protein 2
MYIYIHIYMYVCMYIYTYIHAVREAPGTPMTSALNDVAWLHNYLEGESTHPDPVLISFFESCDPNHNPRAAIENRVRDLPARFAEARPESRLNKMGQMVLDSGIKLYYKSLRAIVRKEEERLRRRDFTDMLNDDAMHRALLAICFEIVLFVYERVSIPSAAVSQALHVCEFELLVMIENFLRDFEFVLSREARRHIVQRLNSIVDCDAWK